MSRHHDPSVPFATSGRVTTRRIPRKRTDVAQKHGTVEFINFAGYEPSIVSEMVTT